MLRDCTERSRDPLVSLLRGLLPKEMVPVCLQATGVSGKIPSGSVTEKQRARLVEWLKELRLEVTGSRPVEEAIVTAGGVNTAEIDPESMESLKCKGLYIVG